jgi:hypothetical protein
MIFKTPLYTTIGSLKISFAKSLNIYHNPPHQDRMLSTINPICPEHPLTELQKSADWTLGGTLGT